MVPRFARAVLRSGSSGSGLTWLWPRMALAILTMYVLVMQRVAGPEAYTIRVLEPTTNGSCGNAFFHRTTNAAGKASRTTGSSYPARFPSCICSTMENAFPQKPRWSWVRDHGAHRVGLDQPPAVSRAHGQCRQSQRGQSHTSQSPRARAQSRKRRAGTIRNSPRPPTWFLWERVFSIGDPVVRLAFPAALVVRWKNAFPQ